MSPAPLLVRRRREDDLPGCVRALRATHIEDGYPARWPADPIDWLTPPGLEAAWVMEQDGEILGHVCVVRRAPDPLSASGAGLPGDGPAEVSRLFVSPAARRQRTGSALLGTASSWAATRGVRLMLDVVDDGGPAVRLYERMGWVLTGTRAADWTMPSGTRPVLRIYRAPATAEPDSS